MLYIKSHTIYYGTRVTCSQLLLGLLTYPKHSKYYCRVVLHILGTSATCTLVCPSEAMRNIATLRAVNKDTVSCSQMACFRTASSYSSGSGTNCLRHLRYTRVGLTPRGTLADIDYLWGWVWCVGGSTGQAWEEPHLVDRDGVGGMVRSRSVDLTGKSLTGALRSQVLSEACGHQTIECWEERTHSPMSCRMACSPFGLSPMRTWYSCTTVCVNTGATVGTRYGDRGWVQCANILGGDPCVTYGRTW